MKIEVTYHGIDRNGADCYEIRPILQGIDPLFDIDFDYDAEQYNVYFNGGLFQSVPWNEFDRDTIEHISEVYWENTYGDVMKDVDEHNAKIKRSEESKREDMIHEMSKDLQKAILKEF